MSNQIRHRYIMPWSYDFAAERSSFFIQWHSRWKLRHKLMYNLTAEKSSFLIRCIHREHWNRHKRMYDLTAEESLVLINCIRGENYDTCFSTDDANLHDRVLPRNWYVTRDDLRQLRRLVQHAVHNGRIQRNKDWKWEHPRTPRVQVTVGVVPQYSGGFTQVVAAPLWCTSRWLGHTRRIFPKERNP